VIARIDDRDYRVALAQAEAQVAAAQASIENIDAQLDVQQAQIAANQAQVDQAQAALVFAEQQAARYEHLEQTGYGTVQNAQQYTSQLHQQQAALQSAQATLKLAQRQVEALKAQRNSAIASLGQKPSVTRRNSIFPIRRLRPPSRDVLSTSAAQSASSHSRART
jgi:membrane fusion protein (multidrug efflux system)